MPSKRDKLNSGFEDVVDFREPEIRKASEVRSPTFLEKSLAYEPRSLLEGIFLNNLGSLCVHVFVLLLGIIPALIAVYVIQIEAAGAETAFLAFLGLSFLGGFFVYTFLAYRLLKPLPKRNLLSVAALVVPILMTGTMALLLNATSIQAVVLMESPAYIFVMLFNVWYNVVALIMLYSIQPSDYISYESMINTTLIVSLIPPTFTYLGLHLKMRRLNQRGEEEVHA